MARALAFLAVMLWLTAQAQAVTDAQVQGAIERIQRYLLTQQDPATGGWAGRYASSRLNRGGEAALVTYALLQSGMSVQDPNVGRAVDFLRSVQMTGTYAVALRAHCWAALPNRYRPQLARDARWLIKAQDDGLFDYTQRIGPRFDHSLTQYGLLGLWESAKRGGPSSSGVWRHAVKHFTQVQNPDGGFGYQSGDRSTPAMTAAGVTALLIAQERLYLGLHRPPPQVAQAIERGVAWLDNYTAGGGRFMAGRWGMYYPASLERVALASGIKTFGGQDWFDHGAQQILLLEQGDGSIRGNLVDTAFALLFLSRGKAPVWINKLRLPNKHWNNRPNDLNILTRKMSDLFEQELNWQVVDAGADPGLWLNAPVAYLASDQPPSLSATALASLKTYLDLGGVLVATPDADPQAFADAVFQLAEKIYPHLRFQRAGPDHPLLGLIYPVGVPEHKRPWVLSNGVRDLIVLAPSDWGMSLQSGRLEHRIGARRIMTNLHALVTDRGRVGHRLDSPLAPRNDRPSTGRLVVLRVADEQHRPVEPLAWEPLRNRLFNRTGLELAIHDTPLNKANDFDAVLIYLGGVGAGGGDGDDRLTPVQLRSVVRFVGQGGTVLVESIGGTSPYAQQISAQLQAVFNQPASAIASDHPILTGAGLAGGFNHQDLGYRRFSVLNMGLISASRLEAIQVGGRAAVIISHEDISLGVLGARRWGINGYDIDSARGLLTNILLYAHDQLGRVP